MLEKPLEELENVEEESKEESMVNQSSLLSSAIQLKGIARQRGNNSDRHPSPDADEDSLRELGGKV